ncbi:MAG TPA: 3-dehydroquinate synthase [Candidatus Sulfomarinibacteraceae bacterium]|nr:3-dehydroquinate synthase [Candidatus Sulfomarinibacteraceae bacterium]
MDVVLIGLPGSGKSAVGRRLAVRHDAAFIDLDELIEIEAGARVPEIFADEGEAGFRIRERAAIAALGAPDASPQIRRVIAPGGGAIVDPRNRWRLFRGRVPIWLDGRPEVLAQRLRRSPNVRPLIAGRDPIRALRELTVSRGRFYAAAVRIAGMAEVHAVVDAVDHAVREARPAAGTTLLRADTTIGRLAIGDGIAGWIVADELARLAARRAIFISEPAAWGAAGGILEAAALAAGLPVDLVLLPSGEAAKSMTVVEAAARELARRHVERGEPLVAVGGGALGDAAGFLAATYLRGVPFVQVPTTLVAQIDSSIGGKTGVDLPEGKNLVGAFHQPAAIVIDVALLAGLPDRERRAALAEAVKMGLLGDERLLDLLESRGDAIARGDPSAGEDGSIAELVERCAWAKVEVVAADEKEAAVRIALNLGHSLGHAVEAAGGFGDLRHGEAVAYGLRAACRIGVATGVTPPERAARVERLLDALSLGSGLLPYTLEAVLEHLGTDKKHRAGRLRWVLPTATGHTVRDDVPDALVRDVAAGLLAPAAVGGAA